MKKNIHLHSKIKGFLSFTSIFRNLLFFVTLICVAHACTTEFEKVRTSAKPELILETANKYYENQKYQDAQALYELAIQYYRGKAEADKIFYNFAYTYYYLQDYTTASQYFKNYTSTFYNSPKREEAAYMSAYSLYKISPNYRLDQTPSSKAIEAFQEFINNFPSSPKIVECNKLIDNMREKLDHKSYSKALLYFDLGYFESAVRSFQNHLKDYPGSKYEGEAQFLMIKSSYELAVNSVIEKREERFNETIVLGNKYLEKLAKRTFRNEVKDIINKSKERLTKLKA
jgi:outer membrane protein assembly factor BamD